MSDRDAAENKTTFISLADYTVPATPTDETLRSVLRRLGDRITNVPKDDPVIAEDRLHHTGAARLERIAAPPACGPVLEEMTRCFAPWLAGQDQSRLKVVVLPPCEPDDLMRVWAGRHNLPVLDAPARDRLLGLQDLPDLSGDGVLVVPRLEDWFLRHRSGLGAIRALMQALAGSDRRVLFGCNSVAWAYLGQALGLTLQLPDPLTFRPFDATRLRDWFTELARSPGSDVEMFRLSTTGEDVLATDKDGAPENDFLKLLAARSRGVPWVAWSLWRDGLRDTPDADAQDEDDTPLPARDDDRTLWLADPHDYVLPRGGERDATAVLHALLLHGALTPEMLRAVVPLVGGTGVVPALIDRGIVKYAGGTLLCGAVAYPAIRKALSDAAFPIGAF